MSQVLLYLKSTLFINRWLLLAIPLATFLVWILGAILSNYDVVDILQGLLNNQLTTGERSELLYNLASRSALFRSNTIVLLLPFGYLLFLRRQYLKPYEFALPINVIQRLVTYLLISILVFSYTYLNIWLFNWILQIYIQHNYLQELNDAYDRLGFLYTEIPNNSVFFNAKASGNYFISILTFLQFLPALFIADFYFPRYSLLTSATIFFVFIGMMILFKSTLFIQMKSGTLMYQISNYDFYLTRDIAVGILSALFWYCSFYFLLKEKEI